MALRMVSSPKEQPVVWRNILPHGRREDGFSLIELLIVVAIILIIAAIAIPNLLRARMSANESSAVASMKAINTAQAMYLMNYPLSGYGTLTQLTGTEPCTPSSAAACLIDSALATGAKGGYNFNVTLVGSAPASNYLLTATPVTVGTTGQRSFCSTNQASIRVKMSGAVVASVTECEGLGSL